jgi:FAD/FMN-containing dehydrogenase
MDEKKAQLMEIVGKTGVFDNPGIGESFSLDHSLIPPMEPCFMVKPGDVDEVQKIVLWANETQTPLVPVSSGGPHSRADTLPTAPESVIVDLSGMKRILKIDRRNRLALIEPGVTYSQLQPELQKEGLRMAMPLLPRPSKSVIASLLEEEDWQQGLVPLQGPGPGQLDFYKFVSAAQGSMGIVTWASVKCEVFPEFRKLVFIPAERLDAVIDFTYQLLKFRFGDELFIVNNACLAYILANEPGEVEALKETLPAWTVIVGITGGHILPREKVEAQENDIRDIAQQFGLKMVPAIQGCRGGEFLELILKPSPEPYWKLRYKGASQEIFFLTTLDKTPAYVTTMVSAANEHQYPAPDIGVYIQPVQQGVGCHCEFVLPFDRQNRAEVLKTQALFRDASLRLFRQKAFFSRPYGIWADMVYNADAQTTIVTRKIKEIFDPNHVMNPGKLCF